MIQRFSNFYPALVLISFCLLIFVPHTADAQNAMGAKSISMGLTGVALPDNSWTVFSNTAMMQTDEHRVSFYGFRYIGISEITDIAASANIQSSLGTIGMGLHRYGFNLFNENRFLLAYKNNLGFFHYGGSLSYTHVIQGENYGSAGAVGFDVGLAAQIITDLWFGARATNLNQPAYGDVDEELPRELAAGFSYQLSGVALFTSELVKDVKFPLSVRGGIEFELIPSLFARAGITTEPSTYSAGFGYEASRWDVNFGLQQHIPLGLSPALDLGIRF